MSQVFNQITSTAQLDSPDWSAMLELEKLIEILESFLDRNNEASCLSKFFSQNANFLLVSISASGKFKFSIHCLIQPTKKSLIYSDKTSLLKFWDILLQLMLQVDQESSKIACNITRTLKVKHTKGRQKAYDFYI